MNGSEIIPGTVEVVWSLLTSQDKKVFFYTNGGYCTNQHSWEKIFNWLKDNLSEEQWQAIESQINISLMYNTAKLAAVYLKEALPENAKVMCFGNEGFNEEL